MFARLSRTTFASATRCPPKSVPLSVVRVSRRTMSTTTHAPTSKSSDTPWLIGSLVFFGPALLYLLSPSARKNTHGVHNDHHEYPALKQHEGHESLKGESGDVPEEETMKDDEGTEANVAASIALSQESDVPNDSTSSESNAETLAAAKTEGLATTPEGTENSGTPQEKGEEDPTDLSKAQGSAQEGNAPKKAAESKN